MKLKQELFKIKVGSLNFNTPFNLFLNNISHESLDTMIMHKNLHIEGVENKCSIILFKSKIVKSDIIDSIKFVKNKSKLDSVVIIEMKQIFDVDFEIKENIYILKIIFIKASNVSNKPLNYTKMNLKFEVINEGKIFKYFLEKYKNIYWQEFFEKISPPIIPPPYMYQYHFFLTKLNSRGDEDNSIN